MKNLNVKCANFEISNSSKFCLIAGPCQLETEQHAMDMSSKIKTITSKLGVNFTRLGLSPGMATTYMLPRLVGLPKAAELFYTGRIFDGELAERIGLANYACDREDIDHVTSKLATEIAGAGPLAVRLTKKALHQGSSLEPRRAMEYESGYQAQTIQSEDCKEGIMALLQKRTPNFQGK
mgnify:CR=1 FL=1